MSIDHYALGRPCGKTNQSTAAPAENNPCPDPVCPETDPCVKCGENRIPIVTAQEEPCGGSASVIVRK